MIQKILSNEDLLKAFNLPDNDLSDEIFERIKTGAMNSNSVNKHQKRGCGLFCSIVGWALGDDAKCLMAGGPNGRHVCCNYNCKNEKKECQNSCRITQVQYPCVKC